MVKLGTWFQEVWPSVGKLLALKGPNWPEEKKVADEAKLLDVVNLTVAAEYVTPGAEWKSYILEISSKKSR